MGGLDLKSVPLKSLPAPFLRLIPTISEYARLTAARGAEVGPEVRERFTAHVRALQAFLTAVAQASERAAGAIEPLRQRCDAMVTLRGAELARSSAHLTKGLQAVYRSDRKVIRNSIAEAPDHYRELYTTEVRPLRILAIYAEEVWAESEKMGAKLTESCWYAYRRHRESAGLAWLDGIDIALFAPGQQPIRANIEEAVMGAQVPVLVLAGLKKHEDAGEMAELRTAFWYRRLKFRVLHAPFASVRLFRTIDVLHLRHLAWLHAAGRKAEAAVL